MSNKVVEEFLLNGFDLKNHLGQYLQINQEELNSCLSSGMSNMSSLHPGSFNEENSTVFYEEQVGTTHLFDLAAWHLGSSEYIADTLRLAKMFAHGKVLDFGGGIGTHAIAAASLEKVDHVYFVDLNPHNREFVLDRANKLGLNKLISVHKDISSTGNIEFDTLICLDVLEHLPQPSEQLLAFKKRLSENSFALLNWYFFKGNKGEYPFHFDDKDMIERFFLTLQKNYIEIFHPFLITTRCYKPIKDK